MDSMILGHPADPEFATLVNNKAKMALVYCPHVWLMLILIVALFYWWLKRRVQQDAVKKVVARRLRTTSRYSAF